VKIRGVTFLVSFALLLAGCAGHGASPQSSEASSTASAAPTISISAAPQSINVGQTATLAWESSEATSVIIDNGVGSVPLDGTIQVQPTSTTIFHVTAVGPGGKAASAVTVQVNQPVSLSFSAAPVVITAGQSSTLTWSSQNAASVSIQGVGNFGPSGSASVTPATNTTYTAIATGLAGNVTATATVNVTPAASRVFLLIEENHSFSQVIGNPQMPYLNSLATTYGLATRYFANAHPSLPNYFELTVGRIVSTSEGFTGTVTSDNIVRELLAAGKTWKCYAENLPSVGYLGPSVFPYTRDHNPFTYFSDVIKSSTQPLNIVPFTQLATDYSSRQLPDFGFILPNELHNAHSGSVQAADDWLKTNIAPLLASSEFQQNGILIIVFDESLPTDTILGGGHVAAVIIGPAVKPGANVSTTFQHQSTLRLILEKIGVTTFPGEAATAPDMNGFFQ